MLLKELKEYKENHLIWVLNEEISFPNNVSEQSLHSSKTKTITLG